MAYSDGTLSSLYPNVYRVRYTAYSGGRMSCGTRTACTVANHDNGGQRIHADLRAQTSDQACAPAHRPARTASSATSLEEASP